jgi:hypothetical protein
MLRIQQRLEEQPEEVARLLTKVGLGAEKFPSPDVDNLYKKVSCLEKMTVKVAEAVGTDIDARFSKMESDLQQVRESDLQQVRSRMDYLEGSYEDLRSTFVEGLEIVRAHGVEEYQLKRPTLDGASTCSTNLLQADRSDKLTVSTIEQENTGAVSGRCDCSSLTERVLQMENASACRHKELSDQLRILAPPRKKVPPPPPCPPPEHERRSATK